MTERRLTQTQARLPATFALVGGGGGGKLLGTFFYSSQYEGQSQYEGHEGQKVNFWNFREISENTLKLCRYSC